MKYEEELNEELERLRRKAKFTKEQQRNNNSEKME